MRVICIDDDVGELETLSSALDSMAEFDVESYSSPTAALARIREAPPAIIFSDLKMPRISGLELLSFVRNDPLLTSIPFVIVTQIDIKYVLQASFAAQADDVITKPYDEWEIRARAMALLRRARRQYRHDAFLSYARRDAKLADALVVGLREVGLSVWYDRDLPSGADWQSEIRSNLLDSANVVALWTSTSVKSPQVLQECTLGASRLIPICVGIREQPLGFRMIQQSNVASLDAAGLHDAIESVRRRIRQPLVLSFTRAAR